MNLLFALSFKCSGGEDLVLRRDRGAASFPGQVFSRTMCSVITVYLNCKNYAEGQAAVRQHTDAEAALRSVSVSVSLGTHLAILPRLCGFVLLFGSNCKYPTATTSFFAQRLQLKWNHQPSKQASSNPRPLPRLRLRPGPNLTRSRRVV